MDGKYRTLNVMDVAPAANPRHVDIPVPFLAWNVYHTRAGRMVTITHDNGVVMTCSDGLLRYGGTGENRGRVVGVAADFHPADLVKLYGREILAS